MGSFNANLPIGEWRCFDGEPCVGLAAGFLVEVRSRRSKEQAGSVGRVRVEIRGRRGHGTQWLLLSPAAPQTLLLLQHADVTLSATVVPPANRWSRAFTVVRSQIPFFVQPRRICNSLKSFQLNPERLFSPKIMFSTCLKDYV